MFEWVKASVAYYIAFTENVKPLRKILQRSDAKYKFENSKVHEHQEQDFSSPKLILTRQRLEDAKTEVFNIKEHINDL